MTALISHGLTVQPEYCIEVPAASQNEFQELRKLLLSEERPTAVLVSDDILALSWSGSVWKQISPYRRICPSFPLTTHFCQTDFASADLY